MLDVPADIRTRVDNALNDAKSLSVAYVDDDGSPHVSFYGSTHFHSPGQLALWVRNPEGALLRSIITRPAVTALYGDIQATVYCTLRGHARIAEDPAEQARVYDEMHPLERKFDPEAQGVAVIVDLHHVTILTKQGKTELQSAQATGDA